MDFLLFLILDILNLRQLYFNYTKIENFPKYYLVIV